MPIARGKSFASISKDIAEGFVTVNPIFLKGFDAEGLKELHQQIQKVHAAIRGEKFPYNDVGAIRMRNMKLQRLHTALMVVKNFARERKIILY